LGDPKDMRLHSPNENLRLFLNRGVTGANTAMDPATGAAPLPA
jgi:hypothetical protein